MGESKGLPLLFLFGTLSETKEGRVVNVADDALGKSFVNKDCSKASALGTKLASRYLEEASRHLRSASIAAISRIETHASVRPHKASLTKLNVLPADCLPSEYDAELLCCDGAQVWLIWLAQVLRAELRAELDVDLKSAIRLVLTDSLLPKIQGKGGGNQGWLAPATACELDSALRNPPSPALMPSKTRDWSRKVHAHTHTHAPPRLW